MKTMLFILLGIVALAIAVLIFVYAGKGSFTSVDTEAILASGTPATARIISIRDTGGRLNSNPAIEFQLEVQRPGAAPYQATANAIVSTVHLARFQPGAEIAVKVDPADPLKLAIVMP